MIRRIEQQVKAQSSCQEIDTHHKAPSSETLLRQGCVEYCRLAGEQEDLKASRTDRLVLRQALKAFPRLKSLAYADYRSLAFEGEDYQTCCARLFGHILEPERLRAGTFQWLPFCELLDTLHDAEAQMRDIVVGGHQWSFPVGDYKSGAGKRFEETPTVTLRFYFDPNRSLVREYPYLNRCRRLCLPIAIGDENINDITALNFAFEHSPLPSMLASAAVSLRILELGAVDLMPGKKWDDEDDWPPSDPFEDALSPAAPSILSRLLFPIQFPCLERLALRGWTIRTSELPDFLLHMRDHLQELRLEYNILFGDSQELARRGGAQLSLTGVVLHNYESQDEGFAKYGLADERDLKCEGLWLDGRTNAIPAGSIL